MRRGFVWKLRLIAPAGAARPAKPAVLLAYVVPFVVLIGVVAACYLLGAGDGAAVLAGLGSVVLYYGILWLLRRKIDNAIHFTISE